MSGFLDMAAADIHGVFLNTDEYAQTRTVIYDGETIEDIPVVLSGVKEKDRKQPDSDHARGLYKVTAVMHCALDDMNGVQPEKGTILRLDEGNGLTRRFYVASSVCEMGMLRLELEATEE